MPRPTRWKLEGEEQTDLRVIARIEHNGAYITQAGIATITYAVRDEEGDNTLFDGDTPEATRSLTPSAVIYDTLQTGGPWDRDNTGYNFLATIAGDAFPAKGVYRVEIKFTDTSDNSFWIVADVTIKSLLTV